MTGPAYWEEQFKKSRDLSIQAMAAPPGTLPQVPVGMQAIQRFGNQQSQPEFPAVTSDAELLGRAAFWGIPKEVASQMPSDHLLALIDEQEQNARRYEGQADTLGRMGQALTHLAAVPGSVATGALQSLLNLPRNLPIVGEAFRDMQGLDAARSWVAELDEGVRASTRNDFQWVNSVDRFAGATGALWYPANAAWKVAGIASKGAAAVGISSPILRLAIQGGASGYLLEGGGEHAGAAVLGGAALGAAMHPAEQLMVRFSPQLAAAADRVSKYFGGNWQRHVKPTQIVEELAASGTEPQAAAAAMETNVQRLVAMANDPAATPETREQAKTFLDVMGFDSGTGTRRPPGPPSGGGGPPAWSTPIEGPISDAGVPPQFSSFMQQPEHDAPLEAFFGTGKPAVGMQQGPALRPAADAVPLQEAMFGGNGIVEGEATQAAAQATKQAIIVESPELARAAGATAPDEVTVAAAAHASNPGGVNVIPAIPDPVAFARGLATNWGEAPHFRFARREGSATLDAITSDQPITDAMVGEYEKHGFFTGQTVQTYAGREVVVQGIEGGMVSVKPKYGGTEYFVPTADVLPNALSSSAKPVPGMYEQFNEYVNQRVTATGEAMGGALSPERLAKLRNDNLHSYMEDFLDEAGVTAPGERARVQQYFNERVVADYTAAVPEEEAFQAQMEQVATVAEAAVEETPLRRLDTVAQTKGFMVVPVGRDNSYKLIDMTATPVGVNQAPTELSFSTREAAEEWLSKLSREAPDVTPPSEVPIEVARALPRQSHLEPSLDNGRLDEAVGNAAEDVAESVSLEDSGLADQIRRVIAEAKASGNIGKIMQAWEYGLGQFQPMRARWQNIDRNLNEAGLGDLRPWEDWDALTTQLTKKHNWENPWMDRWARIMDHFDAKQHRTGLVTQIYEIEDDALRLAKAQAAGFSPRQVQAIDEMHQFFREIFPETNLDPAREIARYISHVKARQSVGAPVQLAFEGAAMSPSVQPFYEMVRSGEMQLREMDARMLGNTYIRALGFNKYMKATWEPAKAKWMEIKNIPELEPLANTFINWANLMKTGYVPGNDMVLDGVHSLMNFMMPGISKTQVRRIFNQGMTTTHLALLGYRPDVMARDSIQLFLALPRAGKDLLAVMRDMATGGRSTMEEMMNRGLEAGTVVLGKPKIADTGVFEESMAMTPEGLVEQQGPRGPLYRVMQATTDALRNMVPDGLRHLENTPFHPLYFYTKQSERMRMVVGEAGIRRAERALANYRQLPAEAQGAMEQLMGESAARTFDPAVQRKFQELVASGNDKEASYFLGRQLADATMFRYGVVENPEIARTTLGRMGMQMGNFSTQFYQYGKESLANGNWQDKAKFLAMLGGVSYGLNAAAKLTGWDFSKWQFYNALTFTGGPWIQNAMEAQTLASNAARMAQSGDNPNSGMMATESNQLVGQLGRTAFQMLNPAAGIIRDVGAVRSALDSPDPANAFARMFVTGQRGNPVDYRHMEDETWGRPIAAQAQPVMQPYASPVRASGTGVPIPMPALPPVGGQIDSATAAAYGATDPSRVYQHNGQWVYDTPNRTADGRVPTHALSQAPQVLRPGETWEQYERRVLSDTGAVAPPVIRDLRVLDPAMATRVSLLQQMAARDGVRLDVSETRREQGRQEAYFRQGREGPGSGSPITWTLTSNHADGRAIDFIVNGDTTGRDPGYAWLMQHAPNLGLVPMGAMDPGHLAVTDSSLRAVPNPTLPPQYVARPGGGAQY